MFDKQCLIIRRGDAHICVESARKTSNLLVTWIIINQQQITLQEPELQRITFCSVEMKLKKTEPVT